MRFLSRPIFAILFGAAMTWSSVTNPPLAIGKTSGGDNYKMRGIPSDLIHNGLVSLIPWRHSIDHHPGWMRSAPANLKSHESGGIYVTDVYGDPINLYRVPNHKNAGPVCQTADVYNVNQIAVDRSGDLWVPQGGQSQGAGIVQEVLPNCGADGASIEVSNGQPADVAFDSKGNIYIGKIVDYNPSGESISGTVGIYTASGSYVGELTDPSFTSLNGTLLLTGIAIDRADNCYVSHFAPSGGGEIVEFPGCKPATHGNVLKGPQPWSPGKPQLDSAGNLLVIDFTFFHSYRITTLSVYAPPYDHAAKTVISLYGPAIACPLNRSENAIYCADYNTNAVDVYSYPSGAYLYSFNKGIQTGEEGAATIPTAAK
jgi:hypothetical protein